MKALKGSLIGLAVLAVAGVAVHVPMMMGKGPSCPFGYDKAQTAVRLTGTEARPMLGFVLGRTTLAEALLDGCTRSRAQVECRKGPRTMWLTFAQDGRLAGIRSSLRQAEAAPIRAAFEEARSRLHATAKGDLGLQLLLQQASAEAQDSSLHAVVRATNMGDGYLLTEEYRAL